MSSVEKFLRGLHDKLFEQFNDQLVRFRDESLLEIQNCRILKKKLNHINPLEKKLSKLLDIAILIMRSEDAINDINRPSSNNHLET